MIPQFIQRQKELQPQYEYIKQVGQELKDLKKEYNITGVKLARPKQVTSFMTLTGSQLREYGERTKETREKRNVQYRETARARGRRLSKEQKEQERPNEARDGSTLKDNSQGQLDQDLRADSPQSDERHLDSDHLRSDPQPATQHCKVEDHEQHDGDDASLTMIREQATDEYQDWVERERLEKLNDVSAS